MKNAIAKTILATGGYKATAVSRNHHMKMDRPNVDGGEDTAATPVEYLLAAIGGCVSMTLRVFANNKNWDLGEISVKVTQKQTLTSKGLITTLTEEISIENNITEVQKERLLIVAGKCPVVQLIKKETTIKSIII